MSMRLFRLILAFLSGAYISLLVTSIAHLATIGCGAPPSTNAPNSKLKRELSNQHERQPRSNQTVELDLHDGFPTMDYKPQHPSCPPRLEFLHIPKTGGTTIEETATMQANIAWGSCHFHLNIKKPWKICPRKLLITPTKKKWPKHELLVNLWHYPLHWLENNHTMTVRHIPSNPYHNLARGNIIPPASSSPCSVVYDQELQYFAVIRNPYERAISAYYYQAEFKHKKKLKYQKFMNKWIYKQCMEYRNQTKKSSSSIGYENRSVFYIPQYEFIFDTHGRRRVQHILHFENLTYEFNELMNMYNLNISLLQTKTKSSVTVKEGDRFGPQDLYPKVRTVLEELFVNDFALGNYSLII